jgi:uncharacterized beta-barrel protein YwiB (DUF1934 family)
LIFLSHSRPNNAVPPVLDYKKYFENEKLESAKITLKTYSGELLIPKGYINVQVKYNGQCESLRLYVVQKGGTALFGREWLKKINLDWKNQSGKFTFHLRFN